MDWLQQLVRWAFWEFDSEVSTQEVLGPTEEFRKTGEVHRKQTAGSVGRRSRLVEYLAGLRESNPYHPSLEEWEELSGISLEQAEEMPVSRLENAGYFARHLRWGSN
jgi:hypothetical protein